jgi:DNA invertase Pin-like site-specific DNA recombinase
MEVRIMAKAILPTDAAVLYLRMSDERQEHSIEAQQQELQRYAEKHGYKVLREYLDEAISGDNTGRRAGFLRMREDAAKGEFSVVLCWDQDRFGRFDPIEGGFWILPFRNAGVRLETIAQGKIDWNDFAGRLIYLVQQEGKHAYLRDLSRNVTRGLLSSAKAGRGGTGGTSPQGLRNDPERAEIVRRIFREYLRPGASLRSVASGLSRDGIRSPKGNLWTTTTVRYVLRNRKYTGDYVRFRFRAGKYHGVEDGEIVSRSKNDSFEEVKPMVVENHHEGIIDRRTFQAAQAKLATQQKRTAKRSARQYVFTGLLKCGDCGHSMTGRPYHRGQGQAIYRCHHYTTGGRDACHSNTIQETSLVDAVVRKMQMELFSEAAIGRLLVAYRKRLADRRTTAPIDDGRLRKRIEVLDEQIDQGVERVLSAPEKLVTSIYAKIEKLREERDRLQAELHAAGQPETGSSATDDKKVEEAARVLRDIREAFTDSKPEEIRELLSPLVSKIELHFDHKKQGGRTVNTPTGGTIVIRPPAESSILFTSLGS